jgi:CRP/FNR family cyclic AMP-dependent transcriptional regulator
LALSYVGPGDWFADPGLLDGSPSSYEVVATGATTVFAVSGEHFLELLATSAPLGAAVMRRQARQIRDLSEIAHMGKAGGLRNRVAGHLAFLVRRHGVSEGHLDGETRIDLKVPQNDLAQLVGSSRQRLNFQLKQMERAGLIRFKAAGQLVICNLDRLLAEVKG